jgi:hypothetical protein
MSRHPVDDAAPTLVLPRGTRIELDAEGNLSIHAPGNFVVQSSGKYGTLESLGGSIRIDRGVEVEATVVRCAHACYVQGLLTAWKVQARALHLEDGARAHVVLQETERLEIGRDARLVGNFSSEREIFGLFSRFAQQVRSLPFLFERQRAPAELSGGGAQDIEIEGRVAAEAPAVPLSELPEPLLFALVLLEREAERQTHGAAAQRAIGELLKLLRQQDLATLQFTFRTLFGRISEPREDARRARELVAEYFGGAPLW